MTTTFMDIPPISTSASCDRSPEGGRSRVRTGPNLARDREEEGNAQPGHRGPGNDERHKRDSRDVGDHYGEPQGEGQGVAEVNAGAQLREG